MGDGAALVVDNRTGEVLAWVSESLSAGESQGWVDAVTVRRQPGSTLKPFLYGLAMEMGWTAATLIEDSPLARLRVPVFTTSAITAGPITVRSGCASRLEIP